MKENIGKEAILKPFRLLKSKNPFDYFYVTIIAIWDKENYVVIADNRERQFIVNKKILQIV